MCSWLILLFLLSRCCNNGCDMDCGNDCDRNRRNDGDNNRNRRNDNDCDCDRRNERTRERNIQNQRDCDDEFVQARPFSGFPNAGTCGCESKDE